MKKYIGVSLIFCKNKNQRFRAVQSSYIFELKPVELLLKNINDKAKEIQKKELFEFEYLGVSDMYITECFGVYNYLGRTSFFDMKNENETQEIILNVDELNKKAKEIISTNGINVGFVYFNRDIEGQGFNSTIIVYTIIDKFINVKKIYEVAESISFKSKIVKFSIEMLRQEDLVFKGISDFYSIKNEGLFEMEGIFNSKDDIISEIISDEQFERELNNINHDYKYIM